MTAARVIASVEPLLAAHVKMARRHGLDEIRIPIARAIGVMHELQHLRDTVRREQRFRRDIHPI
jgi:cell division protein ZapA (FtsZ GTPase activity inhibitor)